jgi:endonuclease-3
VKEEDRAQRILTLLKKEYPDVKGTELRFGNALELLVATILAAQCTDKKVNQVTETLFKRYKTAENYAKADLEELQKIIKPTGFYHNKAKFIKAATEKLVKDFNSEMPRSIDEMTKLSGVARKTANIVLSNAFGINEGVAVDTHVMRLSERLGFTKEKDREKIEKDLMRLFPKVQWFEVSNLLIAHGRRACAARHPKCGTCVLNKLCPSAFTFD